MIITGRETPTSIGLMAALADVNITLRWGGPLAPGAINGSCNLLNGLEQLQAFVRAGVSTVEFTTDLAQRDAWVAAGRGVVLGRKLEHTQGYDIAVPGNFKLNQRWNQRDFWVIYKPAIREWRVHILRNPVTGVYNSIARGVKVQTGPDTRVASHRNAGIIIRSRRLGWTLDHSVAPPAGLRSVAKAAVAAVGYDLGAVDILEMGDKSFRVLEVNSRPAIRDDYTIGAYSKALRNWEVRR